MIKFQIPFTEEDLKYLPSQKLFQLQQSLLAATYGCIGRNDNDKSYLDLENQIDEMAKAMDMGTMVKNLQTLEFINREVERRCLDKPQSLLTKAFAFMKETKAAHDAELQVLKEVDEQEAKLNEFSTGELEGSDKLGILSGIKNIYQSFADKMREKSQAMRTSAQESIESIHKSIESCTNSVRTATKEYAEDIISRHQQRLLDKQIDRTLWMQDRNREWGQFVEGCHDKVTSIDKALYEAKYRVKTALLALGGKEIPARDYQPSSLASPILNLMQDEMNQCKEIDADLEVQRLNITEDLETSEVFMNGRVKSYREAMEIKMEKAEQRKEAFKEWTGRFGKAGRDESAEKETELSVENESSEVEME